MTKEQLIEYKEKLSKLSDEEKKQRDLYLRDIALGEIQGPSTGYASIDKPWLKYYDEDAIKLDLPKMTAYDYMYESNKEYLDDIAIVYFGNKISYKKLFEKIDEVALSLEYAGVKKGDIISILSITTPEVIYLFYALNKIGAVANMIDPRVNEDRIVEIVNNTNSKLLFSLDVIYPKIQKIKDKLNVEKFITLSAFDSLLFPLNVIKNSTSKKIEDKDIIKFSKFIKNSAKANQITKIEYKENYPAAIVYTGGTTGVPKGAILSNDNFNSMAFHYKIGNLGIQRQQKMLDIMPPFIAYGLNNGIHLPLSVGVTDIIIPKFNPEEFPDLIMKYKPNDCLGVPSHFDTLTKSEKLKNADLSFIVYPAVGGDSINVVLEEKLNKFLKDHNCGSKITKGYGMTELAGAAVTCTANVNKIGSVGIPFPKNNLGIFKEGTDEELQIGEIGEIVIKSPTMMYGYLDNQEEEKKVRIKHSDGQMWTHSQDYGYIDSEGYLFIKGRMKRTIVRPDGHNNYPLEIENVINSYNGVQNSAVVDMDASRYGNGHIPVAFVVLEENVDKQLAKDELIKYMSENLPNRDVACNFIFVDKLPVTNIGKVDYKNLEEQIIQIVTEDKDFEEEVYENYEKSLILK